MRKADDRCHPDRTLRRRRPRKAGSTGDMKAYDQDAARGGGRLTQCIQRAGTDVAVHDTEGAERGARK